VEEPLDRDDLAGQAALRTGSPVPIAAGEGECGLRGLMALLDSECVDVLQPDATRCGLLAGHAAGRAALGRGLGVASHSFTTGLNVAVHLHLLAALSAPDTFLEWPVGQLLLWAELFPEAPLCEGGRVAVPDTPGWGLQPNLGVLQRLNRPAPSAAE
jgi:L-rhamnonate dehydratase